MSKKSGLPPRSSDPETQGFVESAEFGLWGLVAKALNQDGATAPMNAFIEGRAIVQIDVLFSTQGMSIEAYYICNGVRGGLFNIRNEIASEAKDTPTPLRLVHSRKATE